MRRILAVMLIGGSLVAGVSTAFASEREQLVSSARPATSVAATVDAAMAGSANSAWAPQPDHDLK